MAIRQSVRGEFALDTITARMPVRVPPMDRRRCKVPHFLRDHLGKSLDQAARTVPFEAATDRCARRDVTRNMRAMSRRLSCQLRQKR